MPILKPDPPGQSPELLVSAMPPNAVGVDDGFDKVRGRARYTSDLAIPGMAHAKLLRSPHAHARIRSIDTSAASALPGVIAVLTAEDAEGLDARYGEVVRDQPLLATGKVRHVGDIVAAVAAIDEATALRAVDCIRVDYEVLPVVGSIEAALSPDAPALFDAPASPRPGVFDKSSGGVPEPRKNILFEFDYCNGDVAASFAACAHVFEDEFRFSRITHYHLEPLVTIATFNSDRIELWSNNQDPFEVRENVARIFAFPEQSVVVHTGLIGGGFGGKSHCKSEPLAALIARKARRPIRLAITMDEAMLSLSQHGALIRLKTGVSEAGRLIVRECRAWLDGGAYADASVYVASQMGYCFPGPYRWSAVSMNVQAVRTSTVPAGSFRGFGRVQSTWASESQIDMIARRLNVDPLAFRQENLLSRGEDYLPGDTPVDCDLERGLGDVAAAIGYGSPPALNRGKGLAIGFKSAGGHARRAEAAIARTAAGDFVIKSGACDMGQGGRRMARQVAASVLGVDISRITVEDVNTATSPFDAGSHACTGVALSAKALEKAARRLKEEMALGAADSPCEASAEQQQPLDARARFGSRNLYWQPAWAAAEVEVEPETGRLKVHQLVVAADAGRAINVAACHGQLFGGALQGLGQALFEHLMFADGAALNASPRHYRVPTSADLPKAFRSILLEDGCGPGPFGAKGIGEATIMPVAAAIANAIHDALGVRLVSLPLAPGDIVDSLHNKLARTDAHCSTRPAAVDGGSPIHPADRKLAMPSRSRIAPFVVHRPVDVEGVLSAMGRGAVPLAGGIDLVDRMKMGLRIETLVRLDGVRDLQRIMREGNDLWIGATATHSQVASDPLIASLMPELGRAFRSIANLRIRDKGTVGGNIMADMPGYEVAGILGALDARAEFVLPNGARATMPVLEAQQAKGLLLGLRIPDMTDIVFRWHREYRETLSLAVGNRPGLTRAIVCPVAGRSFAWPRAPNIPTSLSAQASRQIDRIVAKLIPGGPR